jgi:acyl dehydratase
MPAPGLTALNRNKKRRESSMSIAPYSVSAFNTATASENKIHDDATAQRFGFKGGFVGGVNVYAYMTHLPLQVWGREWLERGTGEAKFGKPVYDGEIADVSATQDADGLTLTVQSVGVLCATGRAALPAAGSPLPTLSDYHLVPARGERVAASEQSLKVGEWLGMNPMPVTKEWQAQDLADIRETDPIYAREGLVHPGTILRCCNWVLTHNVVLPAWIHMGSTVRNLGLARIGDTLNVRAKITRNYEHKGHKWVEIDCMVVANETTPIIQAMHIAIYRPRQLAEAA